MCELVPDTSALLLVAEAVDPLGEALDALRDYCPTIRISLLTPVLRELERLAAGRGRRAVAARLALSGLERWRSALSLVELSECPRVDECVLRYSQALGSAEAIVLTADKKLARVLKESGVRYVTWWRSRRRFVLEFPTGPLTGGPKT